MKNHGNIQPTQKFNPPTAYVDQDGKQCFVYDPAAWRNKNKARTEDAPRHPVAPKPSTVSAPRKDNGSFGFIA